MLRFWIDDVRPAPADYWIWIKSVNEAKKAIMRYEFQMQKGPILLSLDHDAGDYAKDGGDYIKLLDWLEENRFPNEDYYFHIHSKNPVGANNMRAILYHNGWQEVKGI